MNNNEYGGNDVLDDDDLKDIENNYENILDGLYRKVRESDSAKEWLNTSLGKSFQKFLAADKLRSMKECSTELDPAKQRALHIDYAAVCKLEIIFGSIIADGIEALNELNQQNEGDTDER